MNIIKGQTRSKKQGARRNCVSLLPYSRGFTLVETLVAITILMIAIAGPLTIASKSLNAAVYAKDQVTATYLAQESMETIKNIRDNDLALNGSPSSLWLTYDGVEMVRCTGSNPCDASALDSGVVATCPSTGCLLNTNSAGYVHGSGAPSPFTRYFYLAEPSTASPPVQNSCKGSLTENECEVTIVVSWYEGTVQNQVMLTGELTNTTR